MNKSVIALIVLVILFNAGCEPQRINRSYTYINLINQLTDLECLAVLPAEGEKAGQWSSYDRKSQYDVNTGKYIEWSANGDSDGYIRKEGNEFVFAEMEGPGVIYRIWSAGPENGHVKIYLDGAEKTVIDMPFKDYFNNKNKPFNYNSLVNVVAAGKNCYLPIPYQKSCKITAEKGWGMYYVIGYTTYPKGTKLPKFNLNFSSEEIKALEEANKKLNACSPLSNNNGKDTQTLEKEITVNANETVTIAELSGTRAISSLIAEVVPPIQPSDTSTLRELVFSIAWDNESSPSVWAPLGDFFGSAPGYNEYRSLPMGMTKNMFYSNWYMPFAKQAVLKLQNKGEKTRNVKFTIRHSPVTKPIKQLGRFHAKWHGDAFMPETKDRWPDWTILKTKGKGRYCGVMLHVWNPNGNWWGEGDEKFFIDGEKFPSIFGTGSEDYFGYAFCTPNLFTNCYHNQTRNDRSNAGNISVNRWQITDNVPFHKSFDGYIEKYFPNERPTEYDCIAYWYLSVDGEDPYNTAPNIKVNDPKVRNGNFVYDGIFTKNGVFSGKAAIEIFSETKDATIYYTLDGNEPNKSSTLYTQPIKISKTFKIKARAYKDGCIPSSPVTIKLVETTYIEPVSIKNPVNGLNYKLYSGKWSKLPDFEKLKPIETGIVEKPDHSKIAGKDFIGIEFSGYLDIQKKGIYTFYTASDDGSKLYIKDIEVVDNDEQHGRTEASGQIALSVGKYPIKIQLFDGEGPEMLEVFYEGPNIKKQLIPNESFFIKGK